MRNLSSEGSDEVIHKLVCTITEVGYRLRKYMDRENKCALIYRVDLLNPNF